MWYAIDIFSRTRKYHSVMMVTRRVTSYWLDSFQCTIKRCSSWVPYLFLIGHQSKFMKFDWPIEQRHDIWLANRTKTFNLFVCNFHVWTLFCSWLVYFCFLYHLADARDRGKLLFSTSLMWILIMSVACTICWLWASCLTGDSHVVFHVYFATISLTIDIYRRRVQISQNTRIFTNYFWLAIVGGNSLAWLL